MNEQKFRIAMRVLALGLALGISASANATDSVAFARDLPWNVETLEEPPGFHWLEESGPVRTLLYAGPPYAGSDTEVFARYATPATLAGTAPSGDTYPAVVLVHGGGGTAFEAWVRLWAERGFAAIAMDLAGHGADGARLPNGGPEQDDTTKFGRIDAALTEQWSYHAVANVILAHSLIRSFPEVDGGRTAVTGISWGGYLTCIVAGVDARFKAAVSVYGCGFLHEGSAWDGQFAAMSPAQRERWVQLWDPSRYVGAAQMPVFFVNGTNDFAYWLESYAKTYDLVRGERNLCVTVQMPHGHEAGWGPKEIGWFIDQHLRGGAPLPTIATPTAEGGVVRATVESELALASAELHYTTDTTRSPDRVWQTAPAEVEAGRIHAPAPPAEVRIWFFTVRDDRGAVVSSPLVWAE